MRSSGGPHPIRAVLGRENRDPEHTGRRRPGEDGAWGWTEADTSQRRSWTAGHPQKPGRSKGESLGRGHSQAPGESYCVFCGLHWGPEGMDGKPGGPAAGISTGCGCPPGDSARPRWGLVKVGFWRKWYHSQALAWGGGEETFNSVPAQGPCAWLSEGRHVQGESASQTGSSGERLGWRGRAGCLSISPSPAPGWLRSAVCVSRTGRPSWWVTRSILWFIENSPQGWV